VQLARQKPRYGYRRLLLIEVRGRPEAVRSDNGPEFTSRRMLGWAEDHRVALVHIQPGRPMQNDHVESFHSRLRDECLKVSWMTAPVG
jgi:putative transposase